MAHHSNIARTGAEAAAIQRRAEGENGYVPGSFRVVAARGLLHCSWEWRLPELPDSLRSAPDTSESGTVGVPAPMDVCAACGQSVLTTPDDPPQTLLCDVCLSSLERRRKVRPGTIAANPPQGGLF